MPLSTAALYQKYPMIATDGEGGAIVTWQDYRGGAWDVYAQRVTHLGNIGSDPVAVELSGFRATPTNEGILLEWTTTPFSDSDAFDINRSDDGRDGNYLRLLEQPLTGSGIGRDHFSYLDSHVLPGTLYYYELEAIQSSGRRVAFGPFPAVAIESLARYSLDQNVPNPFTAETGTTIFYSVPRGQMIEMKVVDMAGRVIWKASRRATKGSNQIFWDGKGKDGRTVLDGVYSLQMKAGIFTSERKILFVR